MMLRGSRRDGQTATEYMLVLSVIVTAVVAAGYLFVPDFHQGVASLSVDVSSALATGDVGGVGFDRSRGFAAASSAVSAGSVPAGDASSPLGEPTRADDTRGNSPFPTAQNSTDSGGNNGKGAYGRNNDTIMHSSPDPLVRQKADEAGGDKTGKAGGDTTLNHGVLGVTDS